ncbi:MAG: GGDEF domain-containing protein [Cycloclasticus sp.]|nr:GGDEF domain-containing protein [Cycloclasticus sp.]
MTELEPPHPQSLDEILEKSLLTPVFQPIISLKNNTIYGYEGLIRGPSNSPLHSPFNLFNAAAKQGCLAKLDLLCRKVTIEHFAQLNFKEQLFINTIPEILLHKDYQHGHTLDYIKRAGIDSKQVVIELTEQYPIEDYNLMANATKHYQDMGFSIAIDDLGAGYSGLRTWSEIKPDFVKIDRHFLHNIHEDKHKQQFVQSIIDIAKGVNCRVIAEGIELREEYLMSDDMGMDFVQGYYFARPAAQPKQVLDSGLLSKRSKEVPIIFNTIRSSQTVQKLLAPLEPIVTNTPFNQIYERFDCSKDLSSLPVINKDMSVAGIIFRSEFLTLCASRYGKDLYRKKTAQSFLEENPICIDINLPLHLLSKTIEKHNFKIRNECFIITENKVYKGIGNYIDLLKELTDMQISFAKHMNPLSNLPGNVPISQQISAFLKSKEDFVICYFDLDHFKPYNDIYGFGKGDEVIRKTAELLCKHADKSTDFIGHIGGDDFVAIFSSRDWKKRCHKILSDFENSLSKFYSYEHIMASGMKALNRNSEPVHYPLLSLSIGALRVHDFDSIYTESDIAATASTAKSMAKKIQGNSLYQIKPETNKKQAV